MKNIQRNAAVLAAVLLLAVSARGTVAAKDEAPATPAKSETAAAGHVHPMPAKDSAPAKGSAPATGNTRPSRAK